MPDNDTDTGQGELPVVYHELPDVNSLRVGPALRKRREQLGWTLPQLSEWLRIRIIYLEAFEAERTQDLPAEVYALGFLKSYALALGFDVGHVVNCYKQERRSVVIRAPELTFPAPPPDRRIPPRVTVSLGIVVLIGAYIGWYHFMDHTPLMPEHVPPVAQVIPGEKVAHAPSPQVASLLPEPGSLPVIPAPPQADKNKAPPAATSAEPFDNSAAETSPQPGDVPPSAVPQGQNSPGAVQSPETLAAPEGSMEDLSVRATAASWIQVKDAQGHVVYDHIMQPGDVWSVPLQNGPYIMTTGNAGGIVLQAGNVTTLPLGKNGAVLRGLSLTPEAVRATAAETDQTSVGKTAVTAPASMGTAVPVPARQVAAPAARTEEEKADLSAPVFSPERAEEGVINNSAAPVASSPQMAVRPLRHSGSSEKTTADDLNAGQLSHIKEH